MRFPNQRLAQLFTLLRNETLPQDELAQRLSVSTRTVRADITALNTLLPRRRRSTCRVPPRIASRFCWCVS